LLLAVALGLAAWFGPAPELFAKAYAFIGALAAALPFFRTNRLKKGTSALRQATGREDADQELINAAAARLEADEAAWSLCDTICMESGIVLLVVSFFIDMCVGLKLIA
jgi:membrane protein required for beta-lactamase induction